MSVKRHLFLYIYFMKKIVTLFVMGFSWAGFSQNIPTPIEKGVDEAPAGNSVNDALTTDVIDASAYADAANIKTLSGKSVTQFLGENYNFPDEALELEITGTIYIQFVVEKDGSVSDVVIEKGLCKVCDAEAVRVVKKLRVNPVLINGKPERARYRVPIRLVLE